MASGWCFGAKSRISYTGISIAIGYSTPSPPKFIGLFRCLSDIDYVSDASIQFLAVLSSSLLFFKVDKDGVTLSAMAAIFA